MKKIFLSFTLLLSFAFAYAQNFPSSYTDGKYVTVNGAKLYVVLVGKGDPLIIIPGGPGGAHLGYRVFDSLAKIMKSYISMPLEEEKVIQQKM